MENTHWWIFAGATLSGLAVLFGAFGAHGLEGKVSADRLNTYEIAVKYQMYHGLALLILGCIQNTLNSSQLHYVGLGFIIGTIIFSGSLYILVLTDTAWLGAITPIGGVVLISAWIVLAYQSLVS